MRMTKELTDKLTASIIKHRGCLTFVAEEVGLPYRELVGKCANNKVLQDALREAREEIIDIAQHTMVEAAAMGSVKAAQYLLKTLGKERGFTEDPNVQINILSPAEQTAKIRDIFGLRALPES